MVNLKTCLLSVLISSVLAGCDGGGKSDAITDDTQDVSYSFENIVAGFLDENIDYITHYKNDGYANELVKYYDQDSNPINFLIPTNTITKYGCTAEPLALDQRGVNYNNASFNIENINGERRLVSFTSLPTSFVNADFGRKICKYMNYSLSGGYIMNHSNQKLIDIINDESVVKPTDYFKLSTVKRLLIINEQIVKDATDTKLKPYSSSEINFATHEFIVNKNGEVKTFDSLTGQYVSLPNSVGREWQFYSDKYLVSKPHGGIVSVYDIEQKKRVSDADISVLQNFETTLESSDKVTLSYGIWPDSDDTLYYGAPFKLVSESYGTAFNLYFWDGTDWAVIADVDKDVSYKEFESSLTVLSGVLKTNDDGTYLNMQNGKFIASKTVSTGGFNIVLGSISSPFSTTTVTDFPHYLNGVQTINGKDVVETSDQKLNYEKKAFFFVDGNKKKIIGNPGENINMIKSSAHN